MLQKKDWEATATEGVLDKIFNSTFTEFNDNLMLQQSVSQVSARVTLTGQSMLLAFVTDLLTQCCALFAAMQARAACLVVVSAIFT